MQNKSTYTLTIPDQLVHERLDLVLTKLLPDYSRTQIQNAIEHGEAFIEGQPVKSKLKVKGGETITISFTKPQQNSWSAADIPLSIVYEDEFLLVVNKAAGLVVHPGAGNPDHTLLNALLHHAPQLADLPRAGILHRLDKDTTGLLLIAKQASAFKHLSQQLKERSLSRMYQAVVYGLLISGGTVDAPIGRHHLKRTRMAICETGKAARTHYRIIEKFRAHTHLRLELDTGRTHQIRVHLSSIHHPIVGDTTYGGRVRLSKGMTSALIDQLRHFKRQALHAYALGFYHPATQQWMQLEVDLPEDMKQLIGVLKQDKDKI